MQPPARWSPGRTCRPTPPRKRARRWTAAASRLRTHAALRQAEHGGFHEVIDLLAVLAHAQRTAIKTAMRLQLWDMSAGRHVSMCLACLSACAFCHAHHFSLGLPHPLLPPRAPPRRFRRHRLPPVYDACGIGTMQGHMDVLPPTHGCVACIDILEPYNVCRSAGALCIVHGGICIKTGLPPL